MVSLRLTGALAVVLVLICALTTGGLTLAPNTWVEIVLILAGGLAVAVTLIEGRGLPRGPGALACLCFIALTVETAVSLEWSIAPDLSWVEAGRTAAYLAVFLTGVALSRRFAGRSGAVAVAVALASVAVGLYALFVKVFTLGVQGQPALGRLLTPFGYWNATGVAAALGIVPLVWLGSRREGSPRLRALAPAGITLLVPVLLLSYSRSALASALVGAGLFAYLSANRLRALAVAIFGAAVGGLVSLWALSTPGIRRDIGSQYVANTTHSDRVSSGHILGVVLVVAVLVAWELGSRLITAADAGRVPSELHRRAARATAWLPVAALLLVIVGLALSSRGLTGEVSHVIDQLTTTKPTVSTNAARLAALSSSRPDYWRQALAVGNHHPLLGSGPGTFAIARLAYPSSQLIFGGTQLNAHSYLFETYATLGLLGLALSLGLALAWLTGAWRSLAAPPEPGRAGQPGQEREGRLTLIAIVLTFTVSSAIDWTWFVPGLAAPALLCAGWVAGLGGWERRARATRLRVLVAGLVVVLAAVAAYETWRPLHASQEVAAAAQAAANLRGGEALADVRAALSAVPQSLAARQEESAIYWAAGDRRQAQAVLAAALREEPNNPQALDALGGYLLCYAHRPRTAAVLLIRASGLDRVDQFGSEDLYNASTNSPQARKEECTRWATP